jgi:hypothetical protein
VPKHPLRGALVGASLPHAALPVAIGVTVLPDLAALHQLLSHLTPPPSSSWA